jgi:hypothetical protein
MKTTASKQCFALKGATLAWMKFYVDKKSNTVRVHGAAGCASYTDRTMAADEARKIWRELLADGWEQRPASEAPRDWWFWN